MKRFISFTEKLLLLSLLPLLAFGGDWNKNNYRIGYEYNGLKADSIFISPSDTIKNKRNGSIALLNNKLYVSDGTKWYDSQLNVDTINKIATKYDVSKKLDINGNGSHLTGITKTQVGLSNVDNTSDANKPISTATQAALNIKEDTLPATPSSPETKYLNGNRQWSEISVGSGGYSAHLYPTTTASNVSGYYTLSYTNQASASTGSYTVNNNEILTNTFLYPDTIGTTVINGGIWSSRIRAYVSSAVGVTRLRAELFLRHSNGTETTLFSVYSNEIDNTSASFITTEINEQQYSCATTDRLGIRNYVSTTSLANITVSIVVGGNYASYIDIPLIPRHDQFRLLNGNDSYQHITSTQKSQLHTHTNKSALDLVSGTNTGDETLSTIKSKLGKVSSSNDGYIGYEQFNALSAKQDALGYTPVNSASVGAANGVAPLDASAKISTSYLPSVVLGAMKYQGTYDASTGNYPTSPTQGNYWVVSVAGTISSVSYKVGDWMAYNGSGWDKIDNQQTVSSVFGRTGAVSAVSGDYNTSQVTENGNLYYTDSRARSSINNTVPALTYNQGTGVLSQNSGYYYPTTNDQTNWNSKQSVLSGTGIVKSSSGTISYLTDNSSNWNTAYSWGNHASAGYAKSDGSNATGTWGINISGTSANATNWFGQSYTGAPSTLKSIMGYSDSDNKWSYYSAAQTQSWLGLGSIAYKSPSGSAAGKVLTATDASGNCTWQTPGVKAENTTINTYEITSSVTLNSSSFTQDCVIFVNSSSDITITMPTGGGWGSWWNAGHTIAICRKGTGNVTFAGSTGAGLKSVNSYTKIADQNAWASITAGPDDGYFYLAGDLSN